MMNSNIELPYFNVNNFASCGVAFAVLYVSQGTPVYAFSKVIPPGGSKSITVSRDATDISFTVYVYNPPYQLISIYSTKFDTPEARCYLTTGSLQYPSLSRIPCFLGGNGGNGCNNCCCNCCCNCCQ